MRRPKQVKESLTKTRQSFLSKLTALVAKNELNEDFWSGLEETLIAADVGVETTMELVDHLRQRVEKDHVRETTRVEELLRAELVAILESATIQLPTSNLQPPTSNLQLPTSNFQLPTVILIVGVNGSGKTTSIGKLTQYYKSQGKKVILAAADTFRAAAIDQLNIWGQRVGVDVVAHQPGADPGAVAFDAWQRANARRMDYLIVDTAGRLQTKVNLMKELEKIARVLKKNDPTAPHETYLVLDAVTGQNGLQQARAFKEATPLTGLILTKLDGTAKGGIVFAIAKELQVPITYIGTGEAIDDFAEFDAQEFVDGLFE
ncbi:MAG: signal recognition particle-docking protein FtsY [Chloroflexi bacterium]|nr:signal recognition particle-docking protein FtsY [Chloroflexota bacterium]